MPVGRHTIPTRTGSARAAGPDIEPSRRRLRFDIEPLPVGHPMRSAPCLPATPHLGYVSRANYEAYYGQAVENIQAFLAGAPVRRPG